MPTGQAQRSSPRPTPVSAPFSIPVCFRAQPHPPYRPPLPPYRSLGFKSTAGAAETPAKRGRGRPKGSKNKKSGTSAAEATGEEAPKRKRGRPPKVRIILITSSSPLFTFPHPQRKAEDEGVEPPPKRKRGRPPKNPKPETDEDADHVEPAAESSTATKKKRVGRPRKVADD